VIRDAGLGHEIPFVGCVDKHASCKPAAVLHAKGDDPPALLFDSAGREVEPAAKCHLQPHFSEPLPENQLGNMRLEGPHLPLVGPLPLVDIGRPLLVVPGSLPGVVPAHPPVELTRQSADRRLVAVSAAAAGPQAATAAATKTPAHFSAMATASSGPVDRVRKPRIVPYRPAGGRRPVRRRTTVR